MLKSILLISFIAIMVADSLILPPKPSQVASMARYIIHNSDWVSIATISTLENNEGYPFVNLKSLSDGPETNGTGVPYLYMTNLDLSGKDVTKNNKVTVMASLAQSNYCKEENLDPQDPRCARTIISGKLLKVPKFTPEHEFARKSLFSEHPVMKSWPEEHHFYIAKVNVEKVLVLDHFGGVEHVSIEDYFNASPDHLYYEKENIIYDNEIGVIKI